MLEIDLSRRKMRGRPKLRSIDALKEDMLE